VDELLLRTAGAPLAGPWAALGRLLRAARVAEAEYAALAAHPEPARAAELSAALHRATAADPGLRHDLDRWRDSLPSHNTVHGDVHGTVIQAGSLTLFATPRPEAPPAPADPWVELVRASPVFDRLGVLQRPVQDVAAALATVRDAALTVLADDPWTDPLLADRFSKRVGWLLSTRIGTDALAPRPAEAALLVLTPLLHHAHRLRTAAAVRATVRPEDLGESSSADEDAVAFSTFLRSHTRLVERAVLPQLPGRRGARREIAWWLFHRWLAQRADLLKPAAVADLLATARGHDPRLREVLHADRVRPILYGLRLEPRVLCGKERIGTLEMTETLFGGEAAEEPFRGPLLGLLLSVAHRTAVEITDLSDVVVWHLGIPAPVDLAQLRETVDGARWTAREDGPVLAATCHHEAVVEALTEHVQRIDALLHAVRRLPSHPELAPLRALPARASAEKVRAAVDDEGRPVFDGWSRFRLDEQRVRELLMGEQLYQDPDLAIRELYQNALDACRYRGARERYDARTGRGASGWEGRVEFTQGVAADGREYLDCVDNGIGMDVPELTGVFAQAGVRFADLTEFRDEQADWQQLDPPVELHPNSRFGIGVLSYFMLADEIEVTTCRAGRDGAPPGPSLHVTISGPGHLFQIQRRAERGVPGTRVRLYFRESPRTPSCVQVLRRILGVAEFATTARRGEETATWEPGVFTARARPSWESTGIDAHGELVPAAGGPVVWCEKGGALLVDGLLVEPDDEKAVRGLVVDLTGPRAPRLSVDRRRALDDVSATVMALATEAVGEFVAPGRRIPDPEWLDRVEPGLADLVVRRSAVAGRPLDLGGVPRPPGAGYLQEDASLVEVVGGSRFALSARGVHRGAIPDHVLLWRLLALNCADELSALAEIVPEVADAGEVALALPSDDALLSEQTGSWTNPSTWLPVRRVVPTGHLVRLAISTGRTPAEVAARASLFGLPVPEAVTRFDRQPDPVDLVLLSVRLDGRDPWLWPTLPVPVGHVLDAHQTLGLGVAESVRQLTALGFDAREAELLPDEPSTSDLVLFSRFLDGEKHWLRQDEIVSAGHVVAAARVLETPPGEVVRRLRAAGFRVTTPLPLPEPLDDVDRALLDAVGAPRPPDRVPRGVVVRQALLRGLAPAEVVDRLSRLGFEVPGIAATAVPERDLPFAQRVDGDEVGLRALVEAALELGTGFDEVVRRFRALGVAVAHDVLPSHALPDDPQLLSVGLSGRDPWLPVGAPVPLHHLVRAAVECEVSVLVARSRLLAYGFDVPEIDAPEWLGDTGRRLVSDHLSGEPPALDLTVPVPLHHVLLASRALGLPLPEVVDGLRRMDVDVPDLATTIRAALARVPRD
jgi:hypothetical protein